MGSKKRVTEGSPGTRPKRSKTSESSSTSSNVHVPEQLDYDKLATAIIRQTGSLSPLVISSASSGIHYFISASVLFPGI